ncbi:MAG: SDR family oxidoreductase [Bacteroidetes bacterium]|nr:SDR family oxidoreductase [Bacteroidota bacterium]
MQLEGKTVWVTGGRSGIGKAVAKALAVAGATVYISARGEEELLAVAEELGPPVHALACDVTDETQVRAAVDAITSQSGPVDILVNNAGTSIFKSFMHSSLEEFDDLTATNLRGPFLCTQAVLPAMLERGNGIIVMINSMAALNVFPDSSVYAATKGGLKMMTDCLRSEVRKSGIRVVSVYPGATQSAIWPERVLEKHGHKMMSPEDVAANVLHVCTAPSHVMIEDLVMQPIGGGI